MARMIVHKSKPTKGSSSWTHNAISSAVRSSGNSRSMRSLTDLVALGVVANVPSPQSKVGPLARALISGGLQDLVWDCTSEILMPIGTTPESAVMKTVEGLCPLSTHCGSCECGDPTERRRIPFQFQCLRL